MDNLSQKQEKIYFGLDIYQKTIEIFALKVEKDVSCGKDPNNQKSLTKFFNKIPAAPESITFALETATHPAWISHQLEECGYEIAVARKQAVTMLALWRNPEVVYEPHFKNTRRRVKTA